MTTCREGTVGGLEWHTLLAAAVCGLMLLVAPSPGAAQPPPGDEFPDDPGTPPRAHPDRGEVDESDNAGAESDDGEAGEEQGGEDAQVDEDDEAEDADADEPAPRRELPRPEEPTTVVLASGRAVDVGCTVRASIRVPDGMYVVCGDGQLLWVDAVEAWVDPVELQGRAVGLFRHDDRVWVEVVRREAVVLEPSSGAVAPESAAPPRGRTTAQPVQPQQPRRPMRPTGPDPFAGGFGEPTRFAAPTVDTERPPEHEEGREPWPTRVVGWEIAAHVRPFVGDGGGGLLGEVRVEHQFEAPFFVEGEIAPVGISFGEVDSNGVFGASVLGGYDHGAFALGLGAGAWHVRIFDFERMAQGIGMALHQHVRLGARDRTYVEATSTFVVVDGEVFFGGLDAALQVVLTDTTWLVIRGGGGITDHAYGEVAARVLVHDGGDGKGVFILPAIGGAAITAGRDVAGPSISIGLEWRP